MKLEQPFEVQAPADRVWATLTDLAGVAPCLPEVFTFGVDGRLAGSGSGGLWDSGRGHFSGTVTEK